MRNFGKRLRDTREDAGLTQTELGRLAGVKQSSISELETGETKEISGLTLVNIAAVLKVRPQWLLLNQGPEKAGSAALSDEDRALIANYCRLTPGHKAILWAFFQASDEQREAFGAEVMERIFQVSPPPKPPRHPKPPASRGNRPPR